MTIFVHFLQGNEQRQHNREMQSPQTAAEIPTSPLLSEMVNPFLFGGSRCAARHQIAEIHKTSFHTITWAQQRKQNDLLRHRCIRATICSDTGESVDYALTCYAKGQGASKPLEARP